MKKTTLPSIAAWTALCLSCGRLLGAEDIPPLEVREVQALYEQGKLEEARGAAIQPGSPASAAQWTPLYELLEVQALVRLGRKQEALERISQIESASPGHPKKIRLLLVKASLLAEAKQSDRAVEIWRNAATEQTDPEGASQARLDLLRFYWDSNNVSEYLTARGIPELSPGYDGGESDLNAGYLFVRWKQDLAAAAKCFEAAADKGGQFSQEAEAASEWTTLLESSSRPDTTDTILREGFSAFIRKTQGGAVKVVNAELYGRRTFGFAGELAKSNPEAARKIALAISSDPVFGIASSRAALLATELAGVPGQTERERVTREESAEQLKRQALGLCKEKDYAGALRKIGQVIDEYPETSQASDARLRRAYIHVASGDRAMAAEVFQQALLGNQSLGNGHPFNLEARYRLKQLAHGDLYGQATFEQPSPTSDPKNFPALIAIHDLNESWRAALPSDSPDRDLALLEEGGILWEKTRSNSTPEAWEAVRTYLRTALIENTEVGESARCVADLMLIESLWFSGDKEALVEAVPKFVEKYPGRWKEIGTARHYEWITWTHLGSWKKAHEVMDWVLANVPEDAPTYPNIKVHATALFDLAVRADVAKDKERFEQLRRLAQTKYPGNKYTILLQRWGRSEEP